MTITDRSAPRSRRALPLPRLACAAALLVATACTSSQPESTDPAGTPATGVETTAPAATSAPTSPATGPATSGPTTEPATSEPTTEPTTEPATSEPTTEPATEPATPPPPGAAVDLPGLRRGINLAGDFEVEPRGAWGSPIAHSDLDRAAAAGFDHVRLPVRWSAHNGPGPAFNIDPDFFAEVDAIVDAAERAGIAIVLDVHHFEALDADPAANRDELLAIWRQLARRYASRPPSVVFELYNEPHGAFDADPDAWNELLADVLAEVRATNPDRLVLVGPVGYNHPSRLDDLVLPADDRLGVTVHVYDPFWFTTQGAPFVEPVPPTGQTWDRHRSTLHPEWIDRSWDIVRTPSPAGIAIEFDRQFAAFGFGRIDGEIGTGRELLLDAVGSVEAVVLCNVADGPALIADLVHVADRTYAADLGDCSARDLAIQVVAERPEPIEVRSVQLCHGGRDPDSCDLIVGPGWQIIDITFSDAAAWAAERGHPLYLGEFGVYDHPPVPVDAASRLAWLRAVREAAEEVGAGWAVFEFGNEFGIFDRSTGEWDPGTLDALGTT